MWYYKHRLAAHEPKKDDDDDAAMTDFQYPSVMPLLSRDIIKSSLHDVDTSSYYSNRHDEDKLQKRREGRQRGGDGRMFSSSTSVLEQMPLTVPINVFPRWLLSALGNHKGVREDPWGSRRKSTASSSPGSSAGSKASKLVASIDDDDDGRAFSPGKRSPDCMRRCIAQGILHPVQCHSLC